jgi:uncharacterized protein YjhX (UPF0386 family)
MKMTKLQKARYAAYLAARKDGVRAISAARIAFGDFPKPEPTPVAQIIKDAEGVKAIVDRGIALALANAKQINRAVRVAKRYGEARCYQSSGRVFLHCDVRNLDGLKRGKLPRALKAISAATGVDFTTSSDYANIGNRDFSGSSPLFSVTVSAWLKDEAKSCRKVIVRTEVRETPVYALVCND